MKPTKKSDIYQQAMVAVVQAEYILPGVKIEIIDQLLTDRKLALFSEGELKVSVGAEEAEV